MATTRKITEKTNKRTPDSKSGGKPAGAGAGFERPAGNDLIMGRNPVLEVLKSGRGVNKLFIQAGRPDGSMQLIISLAKARGIPVQSVGRDWLDRLTKGVHQGVAALTSIKEYCGVDDILEYAARQAENPLVVVANGIMDPNNLGSMIRSAEAAGAHGIIIPKRNAAGLTEAVAKASAGAIEYMRVARVANIAETLVSLKKKGIWITGADADGGRPYGECDLTGGAALVIGGEDAGLGRLVKEKCDFIAAIPMKGKITSLNASAAATILLYEALRQRSAKTAQN
jgi:23S rRNA (guanosine2251-2'-O)-methyltransferase